VPWFSDHSHYYGSEALHNMTEIATGHGNNLANEGSLNMHFAVLPPPTDRSSCQLERKPVLVPGLRASTRPLRFGTIREREIIDSELRLLAAVRRSIR
jgi:hypothetical protein